MTTHNIHRTIYTFLWSVIHPYKWYYLAMFMAPVTASFYDFANNYAIKLIVDAFSGTTEVTYSNLLAPIALFISAQILLDVIWRASDVAEWRSEPYVRKAILSHVFQYVQHNPYVFFQNTPSGTITSRIKGILDGYDNFWAAMHHDFTPKVANCVVLTCMLAVVNVKVFVLVGLWAICFLLVMYRLSIKMGQLSFINANHRHHILGLIADNISNIFTVFSFATKKHELEQLNQAIEKDFIPSNIRVYKFNFMALCLAGAMYWVMLIGLFLFMIHLRKTNQATSGDLVFVMGLTIKMSWDLWQLVQKMQDFMKNIGDFKSAFSILKTPQEEPQTERFFKTIEIKEPSVVFDRVSFAYDPKKPVFTQLSLTIKPGEKVGLVGTSGAGKSSLVSLLLKYFSPNQGKILIDGQDIAQYSSDSVRENIAVIPQDIMLFHRNILENIRYGRLSASKEEVVAAAKMANIHDFIESLPESYDSLVGERGIKLSGGQRQRIAIARAILKKGPILILDEATSSLDTETEQLIQASIEKLLGHTNTTVIAIAHRLSTLKHMDRIIVLEHGSIIEQGTHEELIKNGATYQRLWEMQKI
jgi:ATP-binding cassette, subfamily B, bacterial